MRRKNIRKKKNNLLLLVLLVLGVSVGYAILSTTLNINGIAGINKNTWDIHWNRNSVNITEGSVEGEEPVVYGTNDNTVEFTTELSLPGDFYEFTVDAINEGTIDGVITVTSNKTYEVVEGEEVEADLPNYIKYSVTYEDGTTVPTVGDFLKAGNSKPYKVRVEYDREAEVLPETNKTYKFKYSVTYEQHKGSVDDPYTITFNPNGGESNPGTKKVAQGNKMGHMPTPSKGNTPFLGWYTEIDGGIKVNDSTIPNSDMTVYAKWTTTYVTFERGQDVNVKLKSLAGSDVSGEYPHNNVNENVTAILKAPNAPDISTMTNDNILSVEDEFPIYAWYDNGTIYWWSEADYVYLNSDASYMFSGFTNLENIDLNFETNRTKNMTGMFQGCSSVTSLNVHDFDTSNAIYMSSMFQGCSSVTSLDLSDWNVSNVIYFSSMFSGTSSLKSIDISNWNFEHAAYITYLFQGCSSLESINLSGVNTDNITDFSGMFQGCSSLKSLDFSSFNSSKVTYMSSMFQGCSSITELDLTSFDTHKLNSAYSMFEGMTNLTTITVSDRWTNGYLTGYSNMFNGDTKLVGGKGTTYDGTRDFRDYAHIDEGVKNPGYLTKPELDTYTVTFDPNGGSISNNKKQYVQFDVLGDLPNATKDGYSLEGWYTDPTGGFKVDSMTTPRGNETYYAHWLIDTTINYNANGGSIDDDTIKSIQYKYKYNGTKIYSHTPNIDDNGDNTVGYPDNYINNDIVTIPGARKINIEVWFSTFASSTNYLAIFPKGITPSNDNIGSASISGGSLSGVSYINRPPDSSSDNHKIYTVNDDTAQFYFHSTTSLEPTYGYYAIITADPCYVGNKSYSIPTRNGYIFTGWNTSADGNGTYYNTIDSIYDNLGNFAANTTLYAMWTEANTVTFNANGGTVDVSSIDVANGGTIGPLPVPTREGFKFIGWFTDLEFTEQVTPSYKPAGDKTIYARWEATLAKFDTGMNVSRKLKTLVGLDTSGDHGYTMAENNITSIVRATTPPDTTNFSPANNIASEDSMIPIFAWEEDGVLYWFCEENTVFLNEDASNMFYGFKAATSIDLTGIDTSLTTNMKAMFEECQALQSIDVSKFNTSNVEDLSYLFYNCKALTSLDLSSFDTSFVKDFSSVFGNIYNLEEVNLSNWDFSNHSSNYLITTLTSGTRDYLKKLIMDNVVFPSNSYGALSSMGKIEEISLKNVDTSHVINMGYMFYNNPKLKSLDLTDFDTRNVQNMQSMFAEDSVITNIDTSKFDTRNVQNMGSMFYACKEITELDLSNFNTSKTQNMGYMFQDCNKLTKLNLSNWNFTIYCPSALFGQLTGYTREQITTIILDNAKFGSTMAYAFQGLTGLESISLKNVDTSTVVNMQDLFQSTSKIKEIDLSSFDTSKVTNMNNMFYNANGLTTIYVGDKFVRLQVTSSNSMFGNCYKLVGGAGTVYDSNFTDRFYAHIDGGKYDPGYFTRVIASSKVSFNPNGGTITIPHIYSINRKPITTLPTPNYDNYVFMGWYTGITDGVKVEAPYTPDYDVTLYARWRAADSSTITFNPNGGTVSETTREKNESEQIGNLPVPTYGDKVFLGWYTDLTLGTRVNYDYKIDRNNIVLYAKWGDCGSFATDSWETIRNNVNSNVSYYPIGCTKDVDLGELGTHKVRVVNNTISDNCNNSKFSKTGCSFVLEFTDVVGTHRFNPYTYANRNIYGYGTNGAWTGSEMRKYISEDIYNALPSDLKDYIVDTRVISSTKNSTESAIDNLYLASPREVNNTIDSSSILDWKYNREYDYYDLYENLTTNSSAYNKKYNNSNSIWWLRSAVSGSDSNYYSINVNYNPPIYQNSSQYTSGVSPIFRIGNSYTVTFDPNGGQLEKTTKDVVRNEELNNTPTPTKFGYVFDGWYTDILDGYKVDSDYIINADTTLYARWKEKVIVTFDPNGGSVDTTQMDVGLGNSLSSLPTPVNGDKIFLGWYVNLNRGKQVMANKYSFYENVTLHAKWGDCSSFATDSWDVIKQNITDNPDYYSISCTKDVDLGEFGVHTVRIANTSKPSSCNNTGYSQSACGVVFEFTDIINTLRMNPYTNGNTNGDGNKGGWEYSELRTYLNNDIYNALPSDLKNAIVETSVVSGHGRGDSSNFTTSDKLYLLTQMEIRSYTGSSDTAYDITRQLDYYNLKGVNSGYNASSTQGYTIKNYNDVATGWWTRTADNSYSDKRHFVITYSGGFSTSNNADTPSGVSPAFKIN